MNRLVYISGALTVMDETERSRLRTFYEQIAKVCKEKGLFPYLPHEHSDPAMATNLSPHDVYAIDEMAVTKSRLLICYVGAPSLGVGMEVMMAHHAGIPIILLYERSEKGPLMVSRLVRGCPSVRLQLIFSDLDDLRRKLSDGLAEYIEAMEALPLPEPLRLFHKGL